MKNLKERNFQNIIKDYLINENGYIEGLNMNYERFYAIDKKNLFEFLESTQPQHMNKLKDIYKEGYQDKILKRINDEIAKYGLIYVLKNGIKDRGVKLNLMYRKPNMSFNKEGMELYNKNRFSVTEELVYSSEGRIDLVIFLNGLPIITFELKNEASGQNYKDAIEQYQLDRDPKEKLFKFNERCLVHFAMDTSECYMTTKLDGRKTFFLPFNRGNEGGKGNPYVEGKISTHYIWEDILVKDTLLTIIDKFVYLQVKESVNEKGKKIKKESVIFPRYHQIDVIRKVLADVLKYKTENNYLIQHSAGSGKTNSIAWLAHRLMSLHDDENNNIFDSIIVITDRTVVDKQLQEAVKGLDHAEGSIEVANKDSAQLADAIKRGTKIIVSTIQKFMYTKDKDDLFKMKDKRFAIIIDEAHSSTSGKNMEAVTQTLTIDEARSLDDEYNDRDLEDDLVAEIKRNGKQSNIAMFAFTATPKPATLELFGTYNERTGSYEPFHEYTMRQAIEEGFILDVLANYTTYKTYYKVNKEVEEDPKIKKSMSKRKIAKYASIHPTNISQKVEIIVEHFRANVMHKIDGKAKAMVITSSRESAVRYQMEFEKYIREHKYEGIKSLVAFTGEVELPELDKNVTEVSMNGFKENELPRKFATDEYQVLLVADKYQTGFDQPLLHTMYIDKKLRGVKAVQTLSRLNRTCPGKDDTFVLDFKNDYNDIKEAFSQFYEGSSLAEGLDPNFVYDLEKKIDDFNIIDRKEVTKFVKRAYNQKQTKKNQEEQYSYIGNALNKIKKLEDDEQFEFRATLRKFCTFYGLMIQLSEFEDVDLHKLYLFSKVLVKCITMPNDTNIDLSDKISISNFKQVKKDEFTNMSQLTADGIMNHSVGVGSKPEDELDELSHIIQEVNDAFGTEFGESELMATKAIGKKLDSDEDLKKKAKQNDLKHFKMAFAKSFDKSVIESCTETQDYFTKILENEDLSNKIIDILAPVIYEKLKNS